ncbi:MAG: hypothetical protein A2X94_12480 [Bdellovibrionales bacterium GWB1_55_8]|nr:MAG: hypothetical protein A2X94_12480 [Bdellovibrionales bacterium GWB1_55_8]
MTGPLRVVSKKSFNVVQFLTGFETQGKTSRDPVIEGLITRPKHLILNLAGVKRLGEELIEQIHFIDQQLKSSSRKMRIVFANESLKQELLNSRFGKLVVVSESLHAAAQELSTQSDLSDRQFIKAFVNATLRTFYVQAKTHSQRGPIYVKTENRSHPLGDISGIIRVLGRNFSYGVMLSFPKETFLKLLTRLTGEESAEITQENQDAAAELMNIIFGQAKLVLNLKGAGLTPQLPVLSFGDSFPGLALDEKSEKLTPLDQGKTVVIPFGSDIGDFFIEVWIPETAEGADAARIWFSSGE